MVRLWMLVVTVSLLAAGCAGTTTPPAADAPSNAPAVLAHVHGLGIDPADRTLYAASHFGVFKLLPGEAPARVGDRAQDTMGFVVVGPGHFLGSGHPDRLTPGAAPHLGLIESTDAGRTWRTLSLAGTADFHSLESKHGRVYGHNSQDGRLMVSEDMEKWDARARLDIADFAVSPESPDVVLASTEQGLVRSTDGARTFAPVPGSPKLVVLEWTSAGVLGVAQDGIVHVSQDAAAWTARGRVPGSPVALATDGGNEIVVATESAIHASSDSGVTFTVRQPLK